MFQNIFMKPTYEIRFALVTGMVIDESVFNLEKLTK